MPLLTKTLRKLWKVPIKTLLKWKSLSMGDGINSYLGCTCFLDKNSTHQWPWLLLISTSLSYTGTAVDVQTSYDLSMRPEPSSPIRLIVGQWDLPPCQAGWKRWICTCGKEEKRQGEEGSRCYSVLWCKAGFAPSKKPLNLLYVSHVSSEGQWEGRDGRKCWSPFISASRSTIVVLNDHFCLCTKLS